MRSYPFLLPLCAALLVASCQSTADGAADKAADVLGSGNASAEDAAKVAGADAKDADAAKAAETAKAAAAAKASKGQTSKAEEPEDDVAKKLKEKEEKEKKEREANKKKWDETIEEMEKTVGFLTLYHSESKLLLEIDESSLGKPFLYAGALNSGAGNGSVYRGAMLWDNSNVLRFAKRNDKKIVLVADNTAYMEPGDAHEARMLAEITSESILASFDKVAKNDDEDRYLIDIGSYFLGDNLQIARGMPGKYSVAKDLSLFTKVSNFPNNVEISLDLVMRGARTGGNTTMADGRGAILQTRHSLCALPSDGYKPRKMDQRVGYFLTTRKDALDFESDDPVTRYINRWRLQKKDPSAEVSEPVEPITYWIENSTPKKWRGAVKAGIEMWEPAFRKAGFSNGIVAKQMPEDADWDPADTRYSVVRWSADEGVTFAIGPSRTDPRTGEIFDADITMQASFLTSYKRRFENYIQSLASMTPEQLDAKAQSILNPQAPEDELALRMCQMAGDERMDMLAQAMAVLALDDPDFESDEFLAAMLTEVVAHEVGHTLGLRHNFKSSTWRDGPALHDVSETAQRGLLGSVMDYAAINIAGPGQPQGEFFASTPGAYDIWAVEYGYTEFGNNDAGGLAAIASRSPEPGLDYATDEDRFYGDAFATVWDMGKDPVAFSASQLALAEEGFRRLLDKGAEDGEAFHEYARYYGAMTSLMQRNLWGMGNYIGGITLNRDLVGQDGGRPPIEPVPADMQRRALDLLVEKGLTWNGGIPDEQQLLMSNRKYGSWGGGFFDMWSFDPIPDAVYSVRSVPLSMLMSPSMYERLGAQQRFNWNGALAPTDVADRAFEAVWGGNTPDEHDRRIQASFVDRVFRVLRSSDTPDTLSLFDSMLTRASSRCDAFAGSGDAQVAAHGAWLQGEIERYRTRQMTESL